MGGAAQPWERAQHREAHLGRELADAGADDGVDVERAHVIRMCRDDVAQLEPQVVLALALDGPEAVIVDQLGELLGGLPPLLLAAQVRHVLFPVPGLHPALPFAL